VAVAVGDGWAEHRGVKVERASSHPVGDRDAAALGGHGVPHEQISPVTATEEGAAVAAVDKPPHAVVAVPAERRSRVHDAAGRALSADEAGRARGVVEETEHGRCSMECAQAAEESRVADEAAPALADAGGAVEGGRVGWEAEENLGEDVVIVKRERRRGWVAALCHRGVGTVPLCLVCAFFFGCRTAALGLRELPSRARA
jgi:hypothetical protein